MAFIIVGLAACLFKNGGATSTAEPMTEDEFLDAYTSRYCDELEVCGSDFMCDGSQETYDTTPACPFNPVAAQICIDAVWTCDDENFPVPSVACIGVRDCPSAGSTTATTN